MNKVNLLSHEEGRELRGFISVNDSAGLSNEPHNFKHHFVDHEQAPDLRESLSQKIKSKERFIAFPKDGSADKGMEESVGNERKENNINRINQFQKRAHNPPRPLKAEVVGGNMNYDEFLERETIGQGKQLGKESQGGEKFEAPAPSLILPLGPPHSGPVPVKRTIPPATYPGMSAERMHGALDNLRYENGSLIWTPKERPSHQNMVETLRLGGGFNLPLSDSIPLDREVPDTRHVECRRLEYTRDELPEASVIIVFYNEPFSTLMRSVHSVLNRTPPILLKEIILVDDNSDKPHLRSPDPSVPSQLEIYISKLPKVRLIRNPTRTGIVGARLLGIRHISSDIFVILDSHIEVQKEWLEPLVGRIKTDRKIVVMPRVDGIDNKSFDLRGGGGIGCTLGLIWSLMEHAFDPSKANPSRMNRRVTDFVSSPAMAGGLFAAHRDFFMEIGGYDEGMTYWGVENLELSFRLWQCGGILECSQCSRVYHVFRSGGAGYSVPDPKSLLRNKLRTMAVWMDEFADLSWNVLSRPRIATGDISSRLALKERLQCKPFSYFLNEVWPESDVRNITRDVPYLGSLRHVKSGLCLTNVYGSPTATAQLKNCHDGFPVYGMMYFIQSGRIMPVKNDEACLASSGKFRWCRPEYMDDARWRVAESGQIVLEGDKDIYESSLKLALDGEKGVSKDDLKGEGRKKGGGVQFCLARNQESSEVVAVRCAGEERIKGGLRGAKENGDELENQLWQWEAYHPPEKWSPPQEM